MNLGKTLQTVYEGSPYESAVNETATILSAKPATLDEAQKMQEGITEIVGEVTNVIVEIRGAKQKLDNARVEFDHY